MEKSYNNMPEAALLTTIVLVNASALEAVQWPVIIYKHRQLATI